MIYLAIIDATNLVLGRMSSVVAKKLLQGEKIDIINAENCIIVGDKKNVIGKFRKRTELAQKGNPRIGPKYPRMPHRIVKLAIRGMVPHKRERGREAMNRLKVHIGTLKEFEKEKIESIETARVKQNEKYILISEISKQLGARW